MSNDIKQYKEKITKLEEKVAKYENFMDFEQINTIEKFIKLKEKDAKTKFFDEFEASKLLKLFETSRNSIKSTERHLTYTKEFATFGMQHIKSVIRNKQYIDTNNKVNQI